MLSAFEGNFSLESILAKRTNKVKLSQVEAAEKRVSDYFSQFEKSFSDTDYDSVRKYFSDLKEIIKRSNENPSDGKIELLFSLNSQQFTKIIKLLREFEKFEKESARIMASINNYLATINSFFKDSSKELLFKEDTSELSYHALDKKGTIVANYKNLKSLSSGEQQILILFSYLAFNSQDGKLFIIDEPELSLHIKWQEEFLESLSKVTPPNTQIILATHSPIIVGKQKNRATLLYPYNN